MTRCGKAAAVLAVSAAVAVPASPSSTREAAPAGGHHRVAREAMTAAMRAETGYDRTATTNLARFQARVLLRLAGEARAVDPDGPPLFVDHEDWFRAYLEALALTEAAAPLPVRLSYRHRSDVTIEHRPERVVRAARGGCVPSLALDVRWAPPGGVAARYSYEDALARPVLRITVSTVVTYRLLDCGGMLVYDDVEGLWGRPTTGVLGALFRLIGEAKLVWSRIGVAADGWQVAHGRAAKGFLSRTATVTVQPDGTAERGIPPGRPDLARLAQRLRQPMEIEYVKGASVSSSSR